VRAEARRTLLALAVVCLLPAALSYLAYFFWKPSQTVNYGELIAPVVLPEARLARLLEAGELEREALGGRWTLVYVGPSACADACGKALYAMRQARVAQGKDRHRVERLWLVTDGGTPEEGLLRAEDRFTVAVADPDWLAVMPGAGQAAYLYLVDPRGYVMMRFPEHPDVGQMIGDLKRLLKFSGVG